MENNKKYYYDCPIKASYMWQYFGIKTYIKLKNKSIIYDKYIIEDWNHRELRLDKKHENFVEKYFILPEYNYIFKQKKHDLGLRKDISDSLYCDGLYWCIGNKEFKNATIIMRDQKQFFMPKLEYKKNEI
jgi:hypothetical protein